MKNKKLLLFLVISAIGLTSTFLLLTPGKNSQEITESPRPSSSDPKKDLTNNHKSQLKHNNHQTGTKKSQTNRSGQPVNPQRHPSKIIAQNPTSPEIPYYLLGSVNDPQQLSMWSHSKIQANRAWDLATGSSSTVVAVIDSGFALNHEDLQDKWFENSDETGQTKLGDDCWTGASQNKQTNNCDDDQNGYVDDWRGYDFFYQDNDVSAGQENPNGDGTQHASEVSGVIAATANNLKGSAGIDQQAQIMPLQVFSDDSEAYTTDLVSAIEYAVDNDANIINLSLGTNQYDGPLLSALRYAKSKDVLVVVASGNCVLNDEDFCNPLPAPGRMTYPALYPEALAVGATNSADNRASYSSYGDELDVVAPGSSISPLPTFTPNNQTSAYTSASGTSFASPLVAGVAALLKSQKPDLAPSEIEYILTESAENVPSMNGQIFNNQYGWGRLNAHRATLMAQAKVEDSLLSSEELGPRQPSVGHIWRSSSDNVASDESILVGCHTFQADDCSATVENNSNIYNFSPKRNFKGTTRSYIFIRGNNVPTGNWQISTHNRHYASFVDNLIR